MRAKLRSRSSIVLSFCLLDGLRGGSRKGTLCDLQYRIDKALRTSTSAQAEARRRRGEGEASDDLGHPGTMLGVALLDFDEGRVDVEYGASPVQTDRACQESEQIAKLITTPCSFLHRKRCSHPSEIGVSRAWE